MSNENQQSTTTRALGGAFGGEMKYIFIMMILATVALFGGMFGTLYIAGPSSVVNGSALIVGLGLAVGVFFGGWIGLWFVFYTKIAGFQHYTLIIRPENYVWDVFFDSDKKKTRTSEEIIDNQPTGWKNKRFILMEPTDFAPKSADFNCKVNEFVLHYQGDLESTSELLPGDANYRDMEMKHNSTDILDVKLVELAYVNVKHGAKIPVFEVIGGRYIGEKHDNIIQNGGGSIACLTDTEKDRKIRDLQKELRKYESGFAERIRQSAEDKSHAVKNEQIHFLDAAEVDSLKDLAGEAQSVIVDILQSIVGLTQSFERGLEWMLRGKNKWGNWLPWITLIAIIAMILAFISLNPDLSSQAMALGNNLFFDFAVIAIVVGVVLTIYYLKVKRKRRRH